MFNILSKPVLIALVLLFLSTCGFGYISYKFHAERAVLALKIEELNKTNLSLSESVENSEKLCKLIDSTTTDFKKEEEQVEKETQEAVDEIDKLPAKVKNVAKKEETLRVPSNEESDVVDIDGKLPDTLHRMLSESCLRAKGSACSHP